MKRLAYCALLSSSLLTLTPSFAGSTKVCASYHETHRELAEYATAFGNLGPSKANEKAHATAHCESGHMDRVLSELSHLYNDDPVVVYALNKFRTFKSDYEAKALGRSKSEKLTEQDKTNLKKQLNLLRLLAEGREKPNQLELEHALLPYAVAFVKSHPNHPAVCTSLTRLGYHEHGVVMAEQAAFMKVGAKFCPKVYRQLSAWGEHSLGKPNNEAEQPAVATLSVDVQHYYTMSYLGYYNRYVKPRVPAAIRLLKTNTNYQNICYTQGQTVLRNPEQDALRQAYLQFGYKHCGFAKQKFDTFKHTVGCLMTCKMHVVRGHTQDCIEKCKWTTGVLFG